MCKILCRFVKKTEFVEKKNDVLERENFVTCRDCQRKLHQICVLHNDAIWKGGFICDNCHKRRGTKKIENKFSAKRLPTTRLGTWIETRVNNFLRKKEADSGEVYIRVVYTGDKTVEVKGGMKRRYFFISFQFCPIFKLLTNFFKLPISFNFGTLICNQLFIF